MTQYCGSALWRTGFVVCALLCVSRVAGASLYEAVVPVSGYDAAARDHALSAALSEVLVRASGNQKALQQPAIVRVLQNAQRLVQRYSYETAPAVVVGSTPSPMPAPPGAATVTPSANAVKTSAAPVAASAPTLMLRARFDAPAVERVLRGAGFAIWAEPRPQTVLWLGMEAGGARNLIGNDAPEPLHSLLQAATARRGLPLLYPLLDLEDQQQFQFNDVIDAPAERINTASQRYQPDAVLTGYVHELAPGQFDARWRLFRQDGVSNWPAQGTLEQVINAGIDGTADALATHTASAAIGKSAVPLRVSGITDLDRFADVEHYLAGLPAVQHLRTVRIEPTAVTYALDLTDTRQQLQALIARGALLVPDDEAATSDTLRYRLAQ
ncbi:MAG: DUF2066 domain-containing protein [Gammaproteobacteria bacterium]